MANHHKHMANYHNQMASYNEGTRASYVYKITKLTHRVRCLW